MIKKELFGKLPEGEVYCYTLTNGNLTAEIINYGGIIKNLYFKGTDVVLGRDTLDEYLDNSGCYGALIGRNSNRIRNAEFVLNGKKYTLAKNNNGHNLHGGNIGFNKKIWNALEKDGEEPSLI